ncbi:hypothetical protein G6F59_016849 [Rhizopus arrhizus]|nr:hypothetical protein G6F59_016849 [Rhizopus arrhizus]
MPIPRAAGGAGATAAVLRPAPASPAPAAAPPSSRWPAWRSPASVSPARPSCPRRWRRCAAARPQPPAAATAR